MTLIQSVILGIVQGVTEFLPISSSGHLVLVPNLLGWDIPTDQAFAFDVLMQAATLAAVLSFFFHDLITVTRATFQGVKKKSFADPHARLGLYLLLATCPAGFIGLIFNGFFKQIFDSPKATAFLLIGTAIILILAEKAGKRDRFMEDLNMKDALWVGFFQVLALFPGISRSGVTITGGMLRNLDRTSSARFSFLMSVPLMVAVGVNGLYKFVELPNTTETLPIFLTGTIAAAIVGYISIHWLLKYLTHQSLYTFVFYCIIFALINLAYIAGQTS
jgi:undecaprenyl-diphosphatase